MPAGAVAGSTCSFTLPSGTAIQVVIPEGSVPGAVLEVADPGAEALSPPASSRTSPRSRDCSGPGLALS